MTENVGEYQALARKYRPQRFEDVVGQSHVITALANTIDARRIHHAYLLTGTRGIGKTTIARIIARSLECENGISSHPCGTCSACKAIATGSFPDVIEIDAASQTKVDDTRALLENTQYPPLSGRYKIYIIDEVHMLSQSSFNALLKTLEEPPAYVKFILATTDPHKIPTTVLSRCLKFQLKALTVEEIRAQIEKIAKNEGIKCEGEAATLIARAARGSMRDALSLCDQAIALGNGTLERGSVIAMLGTAGDEMLDEVLRLCGEGTGQSLPAVLDHITALAPNYRSLMEELAVLFHDIALYQFIGGTRLELFTYPREMLERHARALHPEKVQLGYQIILAGIDELRLASDSRTAFEMALLRLLAFVPEKKKTNLEETEAADLTVPQLSPAAASSLKAPSQSRELRGATLENAASLVRSLARESSVKDLAATLPATPVRPLSLGEEMLEAIEGTESTGGEKPSAAYLTPPVAEKAELTSPVKAADLPPSPVQQSGMGLPESSDGRAQSHAQGAVSPEKDQAEAVSRSAAADDSSSKENQAEEEKFPAVEPVPAAAAYDPALSPEEGKAAMMAAAQSGSSLSDSPYPQEEAQHAASLSSTLNKVEAYLNQLSDTRDSLSQTKTRREDVLSSQLNALKDLGRSLSAGRVAPVGLSAPLQESVPGAALHDTLPEVSPLEANFAAVKNERAAEEGEKSLRDGLPSVNDTGTDLTQPSAKPGDLLPLGEENPATPEGRAVSVSDAPVQSTDPIFAVTADLPEAFKGLSLKGVAGDPFSAAQLSAGTGDSGEKAPDVLSLKSRLTAAGAMEIPPDSEDVSLRPAPEISDEELRRVQGVIDGTLSAQENTLIPQAAAPSPSVSSAPPAQADAARPAPSPDFKERLAARSAELMATVGGSLQVTGKQPGLREGQEDALPAVTAVPAASDALPAVTAQRQVNAGEALPEVTSPESQDALPAATALPHRGELSVAPPVSDVAPETESREQQETDAPSPAAAPAAKLPAEETDSTSYGTEELFVPVEDEAFDEEYVPADLPVDAYLDLPDPESAPSPALNQTGRLNDGDPQKLKAQGTYLPAEPLGKKDLMGKRYLGVDDFYADLEKEDPLFALVVKAGPDAMDLGVLCHAGLSFDREARLFKVTVQKPNLVAEKPAFARRLSTALSKALGENVTVEVSLVTELNGSTPYQGAQAVFARAIAARHTELMHNPEIRALCALFNEDPGTLGVELLTDAPADKKRSL